jgi:hypothetical protein
MLVAIAQTIAVDSIRKKNAEIVGVIKDLNFQRQEDMKAIGKMFAELQKDYGLIDPAYSLQYPFGLLASMSTAMCESVIKHKINVRDEFVKIKETIMVRDKANQAATKAVLDYLKINIEVKEPEKDNIYTVVKKTSTKEPV